jgi:hypothetical protein
MGLAEALQDAGSIVLGPVPTVDKAIKKIESGKTQKANRHELLNALRTRENI